MKNWLEAMRVPTARRLEASAGLNKRRYWFADDPPPPPEDDNGNENDMPKLPAWAQRLIKDLRKESGDYRKKADTAEKARQDAEAAKLAEQGQFKKLYEDTAKELETLKPAQERAALLEAKINATNEMRIKAIPEGMRSVIPVDYPADRLSEWLDANEKLLTRTPAPSLDAGKKGDERQTNQVQLSSIELELAKHAGMKPEEYAKFKVMAGQPPDLDKKDDKK